MDNNISNKCRAAQCGLPNGHEGPHGIPIPSTSLLLAPYPNTGRILDSPVETNLPCYTSLYEGKNPCQGIMFLQSKNDQSGSFKCQRCDEFVTISQDGSTTHRTGILWGRNCKPGHPQWKKYLRYKIKETEFWMRVNEIIERKFDRTEYLNFIDKCKAKMAEPDPTRWQKIKSWFRREYGENDND